MVTGSFFAVATTAEHHKLLGTIESGESVGELGAFSGEDRTLTVKAAEKSTVLKLTSSNFLLICQQYPSIMLETIKPIIARSQKTLHLITSKKECLYIPVIKQHPELNIENFVSQLMAQIPINENYILISNKNLSSEKTRKNCAEYERKLWARNSRFRR